MQIVAIVENQVVDEILSFSESCMLYYYKDDKYEEDLRAANHKKWVKFYDLGTGDEIDINGLMNFEILNGDRKVIFSSQNMISDEDIVLQYGILSTEPEA